MVERILKITVGLLLAFAVVVAIAAFVAFLIAPWMGGGAAVF